MFVIPKDLNQSVRGKEDRRQVNDFVCFSSGFRSEYSQSGACGEPFTSELNG